MYLKMTYVVFFIKSYCPHVSMLFIISSISVNMFDIVTKYDQACRLVGTKPLSEPMLEYY